MLYVASGGASAGEAAVLRAMFEARKRVFVDLLEWDVPVLDGRFEVDQFDNENAIYVILTDADGKHCASARLLPTTRPHILDTLYPMLCESAVPSGPDISEITNEDLTPRHHHPMTRLKCTCSLMNVKPHLCDLGQMGPSK